MCNQLCFNLKQVTLYTHYLTDVQEVVSMSEPYLKYRTRFTSSLKNELMEPFNELSKRTQVPKSRLLDEAIGDLLKKRKTDMN